jgi:lipopolysaccharide export system permease protein
MKLFTRYLALRFIGPFLFGLGVFAVLIFLGDMFDKMNKLTRSTAPALVILEYLFLQLPYWGIRIVPMATLLAALFAVSSFVRSGEFIAVQSAGFESRRFFRPLLWLSLLIAVFSFAAQETVLPAAYSRARTLWTERIHPEWEWDKYQDVLLPIGLNRSISADEFRVKDGALDRPVLDDYDTRGLVRQIDAVAAKWDATRGFWVFTDGIERHFAGGVVAKERAFTEWVSDLAVPPKKLRPRDKSPDAMSFLEARRHVARMRDRGQPTHRLRTGMHAKLAYPFTNLILCALGVAIALRMRHANKPAAFALALAVSFVYIWFIEMGWYLGKAGRMPPLAAAWMANIVFGVLAATVYRRTVV